VVHRAGLRQSANGFTGTIGNPNYAGRCIDVISQSPPAGTRVPKGDTVSVVMGVCGRAIAAGRR
jgi:hypothetical protein